MPRPGRFTHGKETRYPLYRRLGEPHGRCGCVRKIAFTGIRSPDRPARSESVYQLQYPGPHGVKYAQGVAMKKRERWGWFGQRNCIQGPIVCFAGRRIRAHRKWARHRGRTVVSVTWLVFLVAVVKWRPADLLTCLTSIVRKWQRYSCTGLDRSRWLNEVNLSWCSTVWSVIAYARNVNTPFKVEETPLFQDIRMQQQFNTR